jgi:hypothetical protein
MVMDKNLFTMYTYECYKFAFSNLSMSLFGRYNLQVTEQGYYSETLNGYYLPIDAEEWPLVYHSSGIVIRPLITIAEYGYFCYKIDFPIFGITLKLFGHEDFLMDAIFCETADLIANKLKKIKYDPDNDIYEIGPGCIGTIVNTENIPMLKHLIVEKVRKLPH